MHLTSALKGSLVLILLLNLKTHYGGAYVLQQIPEKTTEDIAEDEGRPLSASQRQQYLQEHRDALSCFQLYGMKALLTKFLPKHVICPY